MKVVVLQSSPRLKGNTAQVVRLVTKQLEARGVQINWYDLNRMAYKGCQSCYACKKQPRCVIKDDAAPVLQAVEEADAVIFATPVYMWEMNGQLKLMFDRMFSYLNSDFSSKLKPGKKTLWVVTQGQPSPDVFAAAFEKSVKCSQLIGFGEGRLLITGGLHDVEDMSERADVVSQAGGYADWLLN